MARNRHSMEETVERIRGKIPTAYDLDLEELTRLCKLGLSEGLGQALCMAFNYGFSKGVRAKARGRVSAL